MTPVQGAECGVRIGSGRGRRRLAAAAVLLGALGAAGAAAGGDAKAVAPAARATAASQEAVRRGDEMIRDGRFQEAAAFLREAAARHPRDPMLPFTLAAALVRLRDFDGAIVAYRAGLALAPNSLIARRGLASAQRRKGDLAAARATLDALWRDAPSFRPAGEDLAEVMAMQGERAGAIQIYRHLIDTHMGAEDRHLAALHAGLAKVLEAEGDRPGALAANREALRIDPKHAPAQAAVKRLSR